MSLPGGTMTAAFLALVLLAVPNAEAAPGQSATPVAEAAPSAALPAPVVVEGRELVVLRDRLGPFSAAERAAAAAARVTALLDEPDEDGGELRVVDGAAGTDVRLGARTLITITEADAATAGVGRAELAESTRGAIADALERGRRSRSLVASLTGGGLALLATIVLIVFLRLQARGFRRLLAVVRLWRGTRIPTIRIQRLELIDAGRITQALIAALRLGRVTIVVAALYFYFPVVFSFFPATRLISQRLLALTLAPLEMVWDMVVAYIPDLFVLLVVGALTFHAVKLLRFLFGEVEKGTLSLPAFDVEWAQPTFKIVRFLVLAFAVVVAFPYLPGSSSPAFKGVSLFLGLLFSLGSSSAIANVVAGVILTYTRGFRVGDRVQIADTVGDVVEKTLLVTRIRTTKNVEVTIPNTMVMGSHIINFSASASRMGLILHTAVTIGYDVEWRRVHELLRAAALDTAGVLPDPAPFVLQTALGDFSVSYELNAYTAHPERMAAIYSELHQHIQDRFNQAGVEIMSPTYAALRDGNRVTLPDGHLPPGYRSPAFRLEPSRGEPARAVEIQTAEEA